MKQLSVLACIFILVSAMGACSTDSDEVKISTPTYTDVESDKYLETQSQQETEAETMGEWTVEDVKAYLEAPAPRFFVRYPDNSFDRLDRGIILDWGSSERYTYGIERSCSNIVIPILWDNKNTVQLKKGELVFVSSPNSCVYANIYPVIETGYAMSDENGFLLWKEKNGTSCDYVSYYGSRKDGDIISINGKNIGKEDFFEKRDGDRYVTLKEGDTYVIGEAQGTQLFEREYCVDAVYYLHTYTEYCLYEYDEEKYDFCLQPTKDGYAIVDLSELPIGDYVVMYTYWSGKYNRREAEAIHVRID